MTTSLPSARTRTVQLGRELREARERANLSTHQVAKKVGKSQSTVSRWETAQLRPTEADVAAVSVVIGLPADERDRLVELARYEGMGDWVAPGVDRQMALLVEYERVATRITEVNPLLIPGLLQTEAYTRSLMTLGGLPPGKARQATLVRMGRQGVLYRVTAPPIYVALVGEQALRYPACGPDVMRDQLRHLCQVSRRPNISIQVMPLKSGFTLALEGRFVLLEFQRESPIVQVSSLGVTTTVSSQKATEKYRSSSWAIADAALNEKDSLEMIRQLLTDME